MRIEEDRQRAAPAATPLSVVPLPGVRADGRPSLPYAPATGSAPSWPEPKPIEATLPAVAPFDPELLPPVLRDYVFDVAERQQSPADFVAVAALCGLSAVVGNKVRIRPKQHDDWEIVPNLWGALIGAPSMMKTPAAKSALCSIYAIEAGLRKEWESAQREADMEDTLSSLDAKEAKKRAEKALKAGDRDEAKRLLNEASGGGDRNEVPCPRLVVNDATVEKLGELLNENPRGLLLVRDELPGFLAKLESEEFQSDRAFYLEAFNGDGQFTYDRIGRGTVHIENATLSIIGGVQPSRIAPLVRGAMSGRSDDGLIQRLQLSVWPDPVSEWKYTDRRPSAEAREKYEEAFRRLHDFSSKIEEPAVFGFSAVAQDMFKTWMTEIQTEARSGKLPTVMESHLLKMPKTICSIALIFHLLDGGEGPVTAEAAARAFDWADYLRTHANRLYSAGSTMAESGAKLILERRAQLPEKFTARDIQRKAWAGIADRDAVADAIDMLVSHGYCREELSAASPAGGRPTVSYIWNPRIKSEG
ncbi:YfjI family protein [Rhodoblastus acidophilus]